MGKTATHAVVMARLILKGKDHGPHAFIVQVWNSAVVGVAPLVQTSGAFSARCLQATDPM